MAQLNNPMDVLKILEKSNCRECREATCLAFAAAVFRGQKQLTDCPRLDPETLERYGGTASTRTSIDEDQEAAVTELKQRIASIDLTEAARRLGATMVNGWLTLKILGKDFKVDASGNLSSDIHIHSWIAVPFLHHVLEGQGVEPSGNWVPLRELEGGKIRYRLFEQRCEKPLKRVADNHTDLFEFMIRTFKGKQVEKHYAADISLVLHPLPKVPILICYWKPEEGMDSSLNVFFDDTAEKNLPIESIYALAAGLVRMFEKIAVHHGF